MDSRIIKLFKKENLIFLFSFFHILFFSQENALNVKNGNYLFIDKSVLFYNNGSFKIQNATVKNKGNFLLKGSNLSNFITLNEDGSPTTITDLENNKGGIFTNFLNEESNYLLPNTTSKGNNYSYGQLYLSGFNQSNISAIINEQYRNANHGTYQQIGLPFYGKSLNELSSELGKIFTPTRWSQNEILKWNNQKVVFDNLNYSQPIIEPAAYYILGNKNNSINLSTITRIIRGVPYTDGSSMIFNLQNAGASVDYGNNGNNLNEYNERYNSYLQDGFELQSAIGGIAWQGSYGKNIYQFANPFLTNIDLRNIFINEANGDGVYLNNIYGIRLEQASGTISYTPGIGGGASSFRYVTWDNTTNSPVGDIDWLIVRPLSTFVIKLKDNSSLQTLDFNSLRRFNYTPRADVTAYSVIASKSSKIGTTKQLGIIALDSNQREIGRTYYVVSPSTKTGHQNIGNLQITSSSSNIIGSFEEDPIKGGYDNNYTSKYWLYINEANETDFYGKPIPVVIYNNAVKFLKFEIRENGYPIPQNNDILSSGKSFFCLINNSLTRIKNDDIIPIDFSTNLSLNAYYGEPSSQSLGVDDISRSRTMVVYNSNIEKYVVIFDPKWKECNIKLFDFSGKLIFQKNITTNKNYVIEQNLVTGAYYVVLNNENETVKSKIIIK